MKHAVMTIVFILLAHTAFAGINEDLIKAAEAGDKKKVESLLAKGADVNAKDKYGKTPLHIAAKKKYLVLVRFLVSKGANINAKDNDGEIPLDKSFDQYDDSVKLFLISKSKKKMIYNDYDFEKAKNYIQHENTNELKRMLIDGLYINSKDKRGDSLLYYSIDKNKAKSAKLLIQRGANVKVINSSGEKPLHIASSEGNLELIKILIANGANVNAKVKKGHYDEKRTPLHYAANQGQYDTVKYLVSKGADINAINKNGGTPLHESLVITGYESGKKNVEVIKFLINAGTNLNIKGVLRRTALHYALENNNIPPEIAILMIKKGADIKVESDIGSPFFLAVLRGNSEIVLLLIKKGVDVNKDGGETILNYAPNYEVGKILIEHGAKVKFKGVNGETPLHSAAQRDDIRFVKLLLDKGLDVNSKVVKGDDKGHTPLIYAVRNGNYHIVKLLLENGANINARTQSDNELTSLHFANRSLYPNYKLINLLINKGADVNARDKYGFTPFHDILSIDTSQNYKKEELTDEKQADIVKLMIKKGVNVNLQVTSGNQKGWTPLHFACQNGNEPVIKMLLEHNADVNSVNVLGKKPSEYARNKNIRQLLIKHGLSIKTVTPPVAAGSILKPQFHFHDNKSIFAGTAFVIKLDGIKDYIMVSAYSIIRNNQAFKEKGIINISLHDSVDGKKMGLTKSEVQMNRYVSPENREIIAYKVQKSSVIKPLRLSKAKVGEHIWLAIPDGNKKFTLHRAVLNYYYDKDWKLSYKFDSNIIDFYGTRGAPLLNSKGEVIGIHTDLLWGVPIGYSSVGIKQLLKSTLSD
ncbi:MAG: ankyrin repeat domain-containing protein [Spirochaetota bacterium]|nr:ankyrin repeat domain-containing protein [Spirochaetota bacterium]